MEKVNLSERSFSGPDIPELNQKQIGTSLVIDNVQRGLQHSNTKVLKKNPMKIESVLERVFDFCSVETLKSCRLVSTQWHDVSLKAWRENAVLYTSVSGTDRSIEFKEYLQLIESDYDDDDELRHLQVHPLQRFCFLFNDCLQKDFPNEIIQPIADIVTYLRIDRDGEGSYDMSISDLGQFLSQFHFLEALCVQFQLEEDRRRPSRYALPNVKRLEIELNEKTVRDHWSPWEHLLKWLPNLEALSFKVENVKGEQFERMTDVEHEYLGLSLESIDRILTYVAEIRQSRGKGVLPLKDLLIKFNLEKSAVDIIYSDIIVGTIMKCNLELERLTIDVGFWSIYELLDSCKGTLQYLKLSFAFNTQQFQKFKEHFERNRKDAKLCMIRLKEVSLGNGHHRALCFLSHLKLPKLKKLTIENNGNADIIKGKYPVSFPRGSVCTKLEILEFLDNLTTPSPTTMQAFAKIMPNLVHLTIPLDKLTFQIVCEKFRKLKTLNILSAEQLYEELDDEILTGVSKDKEKGGPRPPNITELTLLTDLKISCRSQLQRNDVKFTDHSVEHGFLQLPRLYSLSIAFKYLSDGVRAKLMNHVKGLVDIQEKPSAHDHCIVEIDSDWNTDSEEGE